MTHRWALRLDPQHAAAAAALRTCPGVEVCPQPDALWLRGSSEDRALTHAMWVLPGERFHISEKSQLIPWGRLLPIAPTPPGPWLPLAAYLTPTAPPPALPASIQTRVPLRLVRVAREQPAHLLLLSAPAWAAYVDTAPTIRLAQLRFALSHDARAIIAGHPLPPLPGDRYTLDNGIALPCGWGPSPAVRPQVLAELLALQPDHIALFSPDGSYDLLPPAAWVPASRSGVRISLEGFQT